MDPTVSIGEVKGDISELVNRVAYGRERIVLTSCGKPKAVLVSLEDCEWLQAQDQLAHRRHLEDRLQRADKLDRRILRGRQPLDVDRVGKAAKEELEARHSENWHLAESAKT